MNSATLFLLSTVTITLGILFIVFKTPNKMLTYFKTPEGLGVLKGILLFTLLGAAVAIPSMVKAEQGWFQYSEVYLGIDHPFSASPQCEDDGPNEHLTSNGGFRQNVFVSGDERFQANLKYTHHSCAINSDDQGYDAVGVELNYRFWQR